MSSKCSNNGRIMNLRYRKTSNYTIKHNVSNTNNMKMHFSNNFIVNLQNQKLYKESKHKNHKHKTTNYLLFHPPTLIFSYVTFSLLKAFSKCNNQLDLNSPKKYITSFYHINSCQSSYDYKNNNFPFKKKNQIKQIKTKKIK